MFQRHFSAQAWQRVLDDVREGVRPDPRRSIVVLIPYLWLMLFFLLPFLLIFKISFSEAALSSPPYQGIFEYVADRYIHIKLYLANYVHLLADHLYIAAYINSLLIAAQATILCLFIGYPIAYAINMVPLHWRTLLLMLIVLPFWTSFLIRVYAWINLLSPSGLINSALLAIGLIQEPLPLLNNQFAVSLGIIYCYLPFMILPVYSTLHKIDPSLLEAAYDLGCGPWRAFLKVTLPLSLSGIMAGCLLVFVPAVGEFVIPELLGGASNLMISKVLWIEFFNNGDWPVAAATAVAMLLILVIPILAFQHLEQKLSATQEESE